MQLEYYYNNMHGETINFVYIYMRIIYYVTRQCMFRKVIRLYFQSKVIYFMLDIKYTYVYIIISLPRLYNFSRLNEICF